jgi:exodeoxyribonuclease VII small subunit
LTKKQPENDPPVGPSFEDNLRRLEEIVRLLEEGKLGLSDALAQYEEGVMLLRQSFELLERAERRIELLSGVDAEGRPITRPFDDTATLSLEEKARQRSQRRSAPPGPSEGGES